MGLRVPPPLGELPITRGPLHFAVVSASGLLSHHWGVKTTPCGDAYIYCRDIPGAEKISLHASGRQHINLPTGSQVRDHPSGRVWREPQFETNAVASLSIMFPPYGSYFSDGGAPHARKVKTDREILVFGHPEEVTSFHFLVVDAGETLFPHVLRVVLGELPLSRPQGQPSKTLHVFAVRSPEPGFAEMLLAVAGRVQTPLPPDGLSGHVWLHGFRRPDSAYLTVVPASWLLQSR